MTLNLSVLIFSPRYLHQSKTSAFSNATHFWREAGNAVTDQHVLAKLCVISESVEHYTPYRLTILCSSPAYITSGGLHHRDRRIAYHRWVRWWAYSPILEVQILEQLSHGQTPTWLPGCTPYLRAARLRSRVATQVSSNLSIAWWHSERQDDSIHNIMLHIPRDDPCASQQFRFVMLDSTSPALEKSTDLSAICNDDKTSQKIEKSVKHNIHQIS